MISSNILVVYFNTSLCLFLYSSCKLFIYSLVLDCLKNVINTKAFQINAIHSLNAGVILANFYNKIIPLVDLSYREF